MVPLRPLSRLILLGLFIFAACVPAGAVPTATVAPTAIPQPTAGADEIPAPYAPEESIIWRNLQVTVEQVEVTQEYITEYGSTRLPTGENSFLWVQVRLKNEGTTEIEVPVEEHFSVLYAGTELKPSYGHRQGYTDYTSLAAIIFPAQELEGWIRFDIPRAAQMQDLLFVFLPTSAQIGTSYSSPNYPYAPGKPTYVWILVP